MTIGVDIRVLGSERAIARYTRGLVRALTHLDREIKLWFFTDDLEKATSLSLPEKSYEVSLVGPRLTFRDHFLFHQQIKKYRLDVFLHPDNTEWLFCQERSVVVVHDLIPWLFPDLVLSKDSFIRWRQRVYLEMQRQALRRSAKKILTVSESSRRDLTQFLGIKPELITVTYEGIETFFKPVPDQAYTDQVLRKYDLPKEFIFYLGGLDERKNLLRLVRAFAKIAETQRVFLVIAGRTDSPDLEGRNSFRDLKAEIEELGVSDLIVFPGFIEDEDLPAIYSRARIFVYPSCYEGFGLPPLEAMACGAPVIASNVASLPEVCGDAALLFDPQRTDDLVAVLNLMLENDGLREKYRRLGFEQAKKFSWEETARKTVAALDSLYEEKI